MTDCERWGVCRKITRRARVMRRLGTIRRKIALWQQKARGPKIGVNFDQISWTLQDGQNMVKLLGKMVFARLAGSCSGFCGREMVCLPWRAGEASSKTSHNAKNRPGSAPFWCNPTVLSLSTTHFLGRTQHRCLAAGGGWGETPLPNVGPGSRNWSGPSLGSEEPCLLPPPSSYPPPP